MKAVGYSRSLPVDDAAVLEDIELPRPAPGPHDLLVAVEAVSMNPVDTKVRMRQAPDSGYAVLGYDAAGRVVAVGDRVTAFKPGDEVFYAGDITRPGTNADFHLVDERIVGRKPRSLSMAEAAALPLTAITAWELLFDSFDIPEGGGAGDALLVMGGAGGVGSILIQLARALTKLEVIATASRPETVDWCRRMGAHHVIDHSKDWAAELDALGKRPRYVAALTQTARHFETITDVVVPRGEIGMIDDPGTLDIQRLKLKALSFHWEFMFTRPMFGTGDMDAQHRLLTRVADLVDAGTIRTTMTTNLGQMSAATLREAHRLQESGRSIGKTVLTNAPAA